MRALTIPSYQESIKAPRDQQLTLIKRGSGPTEPLEVSILENDVLTLSLSDFCQHIDSNPSVAASQITTASCFAQFVRVVKHRFVLLEVIHPNGSTFWLRMDRRTDPRAGIIGFIKGLATTASNDVATLSLSRESLLFGGASKQENLQLFHQKPTLAELRNFLVTIGKEMRKYKLWPENCWMLVLLIQKHLEEGRSSEMNFGTIQHNRLAPFVQLRINTRMQIDLELPSLIGLLHSLQNRDDVRGIDTIPLALNSSRTCFTTPDLGGRAIAALTYALGHRLQALGNELGLHEDIAFACTPLLDYRLSLLRRVQRLEYQPELIELLIDRVWALQEDNLYDRACRFAEEAVNLTRELLREYLPPVETYSSRKPVTAVDRHRTLLSIAKIYDSETVSSSVNVLSGSLPSEVMSNPSAPTGSLSFFVNLPALHYGMIPSIFGTGSSRPRFPSRPDALTAERDLALTLEIQARILAGAGSLDKSCKVLGQAAHLRRKTLLHNGGGFLQLVHSKLNNSSHQSKQTLLIHRKNDMRYFLDTLSRYGYALRGQSHLHEAVEVFEELLAVLRLPNLDREPIKLGWALINYASCLLSSDHLEAALEAYAEAITVLRREDDGLHLAIALNGHGTTCHYLGRFDSAKKSHERAIKVLIMKCKGGCDEEDTEGDCFHRRYLPFFARDYACCLVDAGEFENAEGMFQRAIRRFEERNGKGLPDATSHYVDETEVLMRSTQVPSPNQSPGLPSFR